MLESSQRSALASTHGTTWLKSLLVRHAVLIRWGSVGVILVALLLLMRTLPTRPVLNATQGWIDSLGIWGPLVLGLVYIVAALLLVPGSLLTLAAGAAYGLVLGTVIASIASTTAAALAFLIARYIARDKVRRHVEQSRKLAAVDEAIGEGGWKIVALLRLSPAVPFNVQNYLYGVTAIRFWPCVLASWLGMLPGTFVAVYLGSLGKTAAAGGETSTAEWIARGIGLLATIAVTFYIARLARHAIEGRTRIEDTDETQQESAAIHERSDADPVNDERGGEAAWPWSAIVAAGVAVVILALAVWATIRQDRVRKSIESLLGMPPTVTAVEAYEQRPEGPTFDHSTFDDLLQRHVDADGRIDYRGMREDAAELDRYLEQLADAPFEELGRNEKLALRINAYNAFTLRLILDHQPLDSIRDFPADHRWDAERWQVGGHTWSLNQIEHEQIRPKFREPRIHFALVCAAVGCPPLRNEAYTGARLEEQLADQTRYVHSHPRWFRFDPDRNVVHLTKLYDWYGSDFTQQQAPSVLDYAARYAPELRQALEAGRNPDVQWLEYDWTLDSRQNKKDG